MFPKSMTALALVTGFALGLSAEASARETKSTKDSSAKKGEKSSSASKDTSSKDATKKDAKDDAEPSDEAAESSQAEPEASDAPEAEATSGEPAPVAVDSADLADDFRSAEAMERNRRNWLMYLDAGFRWDSGNFSRDETVGQNVQSQDTAVDSWGPMIHAAVLGRMSDTWRLGGGFGYGGTYDVNNDGTVLGQLLTLDMRLEWTSHLAGKWWLIAEPRAGVSTILPAGFLQERIDANQRFGFDTISGPRLGFIVGASLGTRYMVTKWFSLRAALGYAYTMHFLLNTSAEGDLVTANQTWRVGASRLSGNLGVEAAF